MPQSVAQWLLPFSYTRHILSLLPPRPLMRSAAADTPPAPTPRAAQASSARVHGQLVYKCATLTRLLADKYEELMATGWRVSRGEVRRDVQRLLGGAYEEFLCKTL